MIILDTNVVSEPGRPAPSQEVLRWYAQNTSQLYVTTLTQAEIHYGFVRLPAGKRKDALMEQARQIFSVDFAGRILPFDSSAAEAFAEIATARRNAGLDVKIFDSQIAAIARVHRATVATRDVADFIHSGIQIVNPWNPSS